ncbi:uncharacterized protein B0H18DRAFT_972472 [Fomitopsis serialis]|uniref:uncharacterized protein n=1 Tax=Fomitopsis serialis TaxID=139415 RepID=UPI0020081B4B|nr:uncharacterized protein B0H18DRAFT_972472 [Neoantrodia serialis]KAH9936143.1 hypothetical protein B0H18DRAFT_972472 [Neoantrodia serialis]
MLRRAVVSGWAWLVVAGVARRIAQALLVDGERRPSCQWYACDAASVRSTPEFTDNMTRFPSSTVQRPCPAYPATCVGAVVHDELDRLRPPGGGEVCCHLQANPRHASITRTRRASLPRCH